MTTKTEAETIATPRLPLYDQGLKELLRWDAAAALRKVNQLIKEMKLKFPAAATSKDDGAAISIGLEEL